MRNAKIYSGCKSWNNHKYRNSVKPTLLNEATKTVETYIKADLGPGSHRLHAGIEDWIICKSPIIWNNFLGRTTFQGLHYKSSNKH